MKRYVFVAMVTELFFRGSGSGSNSMVYIKHILAGHNLPPIGWWYGRQCIWADAVGCSILLVVAFGGYMLMSILFRAAYERAQSLLLQSRPGPTA